MRRYGKAEYQHYASRYRLHDRMRVLAEREGAPLRERAHAKGQLKFSRILPPGSRRLTIDVEDTSLYCQVYSSEAVEAVLAKTYDLE